MQHSLAAIRAGRPRTRFVAHSARQPEPRLGLDRRIYLPAASRPAALRRPVDALRGATRGHVIAPATRRAIRCVTHGEPSWSRHFQTGLRRARPRSAAPWRA